MNHVDSGPRSRLLRAAALIPTTAAVLLATTLAVGTVNPGSATSSAPSVTRSAAGASDGRQVVLRLSESGRLPRPLTVPDAERIIDPQLAGLYYWPPSGDIGIFYDDLGQTVPPPGLVPLGTVTSGLPTIASAGNRFTVSIEQV
jgi:hypothetical protein